MPVPSGQVNRATYFEPEAIEAIRMVVREVLGGVRQKPRAQKTRHVTSTAPAIFLGKTNGAIAKGASGTIHRYDGSDQTDTGEDDEGVVNLYADLEDDVWVHYARVNGVFYLIAGDCTPAEE